MGGANAADIFYESFDQCAGTGGNDGKFSGSIATSTLTADNEGWTTTNSYGANKCAKFGASKKAGTATTPALTNLNGNATLTFKAAAWKGDAETLKLSIEGGGSLSVESVALVDSQFSDYTVEIKGGTSESKITFSAGQASKNRFFLDEVKIVEAAAATEVTAPVISGVENGATYVSTATVNISYPELATSVTYSITKDGETEAPKTATAAVEETITEAGTYTVKASATDGTNTKEAEAVTFTVVEQPKAASIAEFITLGGELAEGTEIEFTCPLTVTYLNGSRLYVKDAAGSGLLIYGNVGQTYANGDVIPAGAKGTYKLYNGIHELVTPANFAAATEKADANPTEMAITAVTTGDVNKYIVLKGVTVDATAKTLSDADGNKIEFFDTFKLNKTPIDNNVYNVTAIVEIYNDAVQVAPIEYELAQITTVAAPEFSLEEGTYNATQTLTITCPTESATITYSVEGGAEDINEKGVSPVTIELPAVDGAVTTYTVTAQASLGEINSEEVTKTYIIDPNASVEQTATIDMKEVASENGWVDSNTSNKAYLTFEKSGFGFEVSEGTANSGKYYNKDNSETSYSWRMYSGTNLTVTAPANTAIYGITFVEDSKWELTMTADNGTVAEEDKMTWTNEAGASTVVFNFAGKGRCDIKQINISYITKTSGVEAVEAGNEVITVEGGNIVVKAAAATASVYNAAGQLVRAANVDGEATIAVPTGFYVVKAGNTVAKVIVK